MKKHSKLNDSSLEFARRLRREMTVPERRLWSLLRGRRLGGIKFRRQHPVANYVADFACEQLRLIIELDGDSHTERFKYDLDRQRAIEALGYRVLRFGNDDVLNHQESVLNAILLACGIHPDLPHPNPLPEGEGTEKERSDPSHKS
jgi:very-short-patch-repair endonuclease